MHRMTLGIPALIAALAIVPTIVPTAAPASSVGWKSLRNNEGDRLRWHSCTATYAVDLNGAPASRRKALNAAIQDTENITGVDFVKVPWREAEVKISFSHQSNGMVLATTESWWRTDEYLKSKITIHPRALREPYDDQVDNYRHELGHMLGLDHVKGSDIMSARVTDFPTRNDWRAGLKWLYQDCR